MKASDCRIGDSFVIPYPGVTDYMGVQRRGLYTRIDTLSLGVPAQGEGKCVAIRLVKGSEGCFQAFFIRSNVEEEEDTVTDVGD